MCHAKIILCLVIFVLSSLTHGADGKQGESECYKKAMDAQDKLKENLSFKEYVELSSETESLKTDRCISQIMPVTAGETACNEIPDWLSFQKCSFVVYNKYGEVKNNVHLLSCAYPLIRDVNVSYCKKAIGIISQEYSQLPAFRPDLDPDPQFNAYTRISAIADELKDEGCIKSNTQKPCQDTTDSSFQICSFTVVEGDEWANEVNLPVFSDPSD